MSAKTKNLNLGNYGENIARNHLEDKGYKVLEQNRRNKRGEIDIICKYKKKLVFVEVKTRVGESLGRPEDAINFNKRRKLINNALAYITFNKLEPDYRIDVICVVLDSSGNIKRLNHYENITL